MHIYHKLSQGKIRTNMGQTKKLLLQKIPSKKSPEYGDEIIKRAYKPFLSYIIKPKMERQYLTVDSSIRQDKPG